MQKTHWVNIKEHLALNWFYMQLLLREAFAALKSLTSNTAQ
jgi:hypothetical protein